MDNKDIYELVQNLRQEVESLKQQRVGQQMILPQAIKNRHMGEANTYIYGGLSANRPTRGNTIKAGNTIISISAYFETDTNKLYIWNNTTWKSVTLS